MVRRVAAMGWVVILVSGAAFAAAPPTSGRDRYGDPLPEGAIARLGTVRLRERFDVGRAGQVFFSHDGRTLFTCGDGLHGWDADTGAPLSWLPRQPSFHAARLLDDGKTLIGLTLERVEQPAGPKKTTVSRFVWFLVRWRIGESKPAERVELSGAEAISGWKAVFAADGKSFVRWRDRHEPYVWDVLKGRLVRSLDRDAAFGSAVALSPDGSRLVVVSSSGGVHVYEPASGKRLHALIPDARTSNPVINHGWPEISPDGRAVVLSSQSDLLVFDLRTGKHLALIEDVRGPACFSSDGKWLACADASAVRLIDTKRWKIDRTFDPHGERYSVRGVAFSRDGKRLALAGSQAVTLWDVATGKRRNDPDGHREGITSLAFSPDGRCVASGSHDGDARIWDVASNRVLHTVSGHALSVTSVAFSPNGRILATGEGWGNRKDRVVKIRLFDRGHFRVTSSFDAHPDHVSALLFSPDGKRLASAGKNGTVRLWDVQKDRLLGEVRGRIEATPFAFLDGGKTLAILERLDGRLILADGATAAVKARLGGGRRQCSIGNAVCPPGEKQVVVVEPKSILWLDVKTGKTAKTLAAETGRTHVVAVAPDGRTLVALEKREIVVVWDLEAEEIIGRFEGHGRPVDVLAFSADSRLLATGGRDATVLVWDVARLRKAK